MYFPIINNIITIINILCKLFNNWKGTNCKYLYSTYSSYIIFMSKFYYISCLSFELKNPSFKIFGGLPSYLMEVDKDIKNYSRI